MTTHLDTIKRALEWASDHATADFDDDAMRGIDAALATLEEGAEDSERLNWLVQTGCWIGEFPICPPRHFEVRDLDDNTVGRGETARAAIDAARKGAPDA